MNKQAKILFCLSVAFSFTISSILVAQAAGNATLKVMLPSGQFEVGDIFQATIVISTQTHETDGVGIFLNYPSDIVEVLDEDASTPGVQIEVRNLYPITVRNEVLVDQGKIILSQVTFGGQKFQGSGILAVMNFKALKPGPVPLIFDFEVGSTVDTNVVAGGEDVLASAGGASFTVIGADQTPVDEPSIEEPPVDEPPIEEPSVDEPEPERILNVASSKTALYGLALILVILVVVLVILQKRKNRVA